MCWIINLINLKKIFISSDHAGYKLKEAIKVYLEKKKIRIVDLGPDNNRKVDYPDYAHKVAKKVKINNKHVGILVCGSGTGMNMTANKHNNIRSALCWNIEIAELSRTHNNANILSIPSRFVSLDEAKEIVKKFINTEFEGGRHLKRINKIPLQ